MKVLVITFVFLLKVMSNFAGCREAYMNTSNGIYYGSSGSGQSVEVQHPDSLFQISIFGQLFCKSIYNVKVYLNGNLIYDNPDAIVTRTLSLAELPGNYRVTCNSSPGFMPTSTSSVWIFTITPKPVDTIATATIPPKILNPDFLMFPNPANDHVTLSNETDTIKKVLFFTAIGSLYSKLEFKAATISIPLDTFPRGVYFIQVATLRDKVIMRKLLVH